MFPSCRTPSFVFASLFHLAERHAVVLPPYLTVFTSPPVAQLLSAMSALAEQSLPSQLAVLNEWLGALLAQPLHVVPASGSSSSALSSSAAPPAHSSSGAAALSTGLLSLPDAHMLAPASAASAASSALVATAHAAAAPADLATIREHRPGYSVYSLAHVITVVVLLFWCGHVDVYLKAFAFADSIPAAHYRCY